VASTWCETESIVAWSEHVGISRKMGHSDRIRVRSPFKSSMGRNHENWLAQQGQTVTDSGATEFRRPQNSGKVGNAKKGPAQAKDYC
jgi:hypothetical protein